MDENENNIRRNKFWEEHIAYFPIIRHGLIENDAFNNSSVVACIFIVAEKCISSRCLANIRGYTGDRVIS
jgi:hypothetical protein